MIVIISFSLEAVNIDINQLKFFNKLEKVSIIYFEIKL